ncbi:MAG: AAA family ATPase [Candidatus Saganbacteria bacterium]|nr:AAA family ATPase [Candidatus Saganbacteria bacterium]
MRCPKCRHENRDEAKFCEECGEKLQHKCPNCGAELRPNAKFCDECGTKVSEQSSAKTTAIPKLEDMHAQLQSLIPDALAQKYLSATQQAIGENRPITALFADISGFTPLSASQSSESVFQLVQECFKQLVSIVASYEGSISGFRGDGLLALFGAPILHENDAERAILAAIDMRKMMEDRQLGISIGINTAMMTVGEIQTQLHSEYTAYGTDINLAKRLQEAAMAGQILVGSGTHRLTRRAFDFQEIPSLELKGFSQPVTAYVLQHIKSHPEKLRGIEGLRARMVGRDKEYEELIDVTEEWIAGKGQIISIVGEAGIGKSRLVSELKGHLETDSSHAHLYLEGRCISIGQPISYWPFLDILRSWFSLSEEDTEAEMANKVRQQIESFMPDRTDDILPFLGQLMNLQFGGEIDTRLTHYSPEQVKQGIMMRLRDIFEALSQRNNLMLILEDLHWADELSLDLISLLMDELMAHPLMLVCVYRPEQGHNVSRLSSIARRKCLERYTEIALKPLPDPEGRRLVHELLAIDDLPDSVRDMILAKSEGNPFFIEEVIRSLMEQGLVYKDDDSWVAKADVIEVQVPDTIQSVILERVDRLESEAKYVLQCASVIGRLFKYRLLDHITQKQKELDGYLDEFEERYLVYPERTVPEMEYAFKHVLTQEATYQGILEQRKQAFHRNVALGIERLYKERIEDFYEELVYHWERSKDREKTLEYLVKAGKKSAKHYLNQVAIDYYTLAIKMANEVGILEDRLAEIYEARGWVYNDMGFYEESISDMMKAADFYANKSKRANMYRQIARNYWARITDIEQGSQYFYKAIEEIDPSDKSRETAGIYEDAGAFFIYMGGDTKEGERLLRKAIAISEEMGYNDLLAMHYRWLYILNWSSDEEEFRKQRQFAREKAISYLPYLKPNLSQYAEVCGQLGWGFHFDDRFLIEAFESAVKSENNWSVVAFGSMLAIIYCGQGKIQKAIEVYEQGWRSAVLSRQLQGGHVIRLTIGLVGMYVSREDRSRLLDMMLQMVDSTIELHSKSEVHPTVQHRWNEILEGIYKIIHAMAPEIYYELEHLLESHLNETNTDGVRFFYYGQLMLLALLDGRPVDAESYMQELLKLHPYAGSFAQRISKKLLYDIELMNALSEQRMSITTNLLRSSEKFDDFEKALDAMSWVLTKDEISAAIDWTHLNYTVLNELQKQRRLLLIYSERSDILRDVEYIYDCYDYRSKLQSLADQVQQTAANALQEEGITQLFLEQMEPLEIGLLELMDQFKQDPTTAGWEWVDPTGYCRYKSDEEGYLQIDVPPGHELSEGFYMRNAPLMLRTISGDFILETKIADGSTGIKRGGLLLWNSETNFARFGVDFDYISYKATANGKFISPGVHPFKAERVWLRLERKGSRFTGYVSNDGKYWYRCGWADITMNDSIKVGIYASCFYPPATSTRFEYFKIYRPK